ncbi:uncharacterized protein LOC113462730 [Phoenix dactylifera]|uniref:Uncharacterized protein LOC113462730 n=1 Tax=Phoenix dactylifera TaxID=42345 RepID=A0A8B9AQN2_PHODC|nr:uncharacterized protein LOC113462730 [Phoenix dactylifera]
MATQFWICDRIIGWLRKEGDQSPIELRRRLLQFHHLELLYHRVWRGKELAMSMIHGNWADSFERMEDFKEELLRRNPAGCRPFIGLDGCHLKRKFRGVMMAATSLDGNNGLFPVAFGIAESENSDSWIWFLEALKESIQTPEESFNAWISEARHRPVLDLLDVVRQKIMMKMEARRRMAARWKGNLVPVVIKYVRDISLKLGDYNVYRTSDYRAEVIETNGRHEVILNEQRCSCRLWEVSGIPCVHAVAFICSMRGANLENFVSEYFTIAKYKTVYALEIGPLPDKAQWIKVDLGYKI